MRRESSLRRLSAASFLAEVKSGGVGSSKIRAHSLWRTASRLRQLRLQLFQFRADDDRAVRRVGVFAEIVLVVFLRLEEFGQGNDLSDDGARKPPLGQFFCFLSGLLLGVVVV